MKKFISENRKTAIIILAILLLVLILLILLLVTKRMDTKYADGYMLDEEVVELPGTKVLTNDNLKTEHCLEDICVSDITIYKVNQDGRLECKVTNKSNETKSGYLKLNFAETSFIISYNKLRPESSATSVAQYTNKTVNDISDYSLTKLSEQEKNKIIKSK